VRTAPRAGAAAAPARRSGPRAAAPPKRDPALAALRRAARITVAACIGFYVCQYLFDDTTTAVYALFSAIALGALSNVAGLTCAMRWSPPTRCTASALEPTSWPPAAGITCSPSRATSRRCGRR
jgi:hypothetical protein